MTKQELINACAMKMFYFSYETRGYDKVWCIEAFENNRHDSAQFLEYAHICFNEMENAELCEESI